MYKGTVGTKLEKNCNPIIKNKENNPKPFNQNLKVVVSQKTYIGVRLSVPGTWPGVLGKSFRVSPLGVEGKEGVRTSSEAGRLSVA